MVDLIDDFVPALGDVAFPPTVELQPPELLADMLAFLQLNGATDLDVDPGCGRREAGEDTTWYPLVIAQMGEAQWFMRPATARALAVLVAGDRRFPLFFEDTPSVGSIFSRAADEAERLAAEATAGRDPFHKQK